MLFSIKIYHENRRTCLQVQFLMFWMSRGTQGPGKRVMRQGNQCIDCATSNCGCLWPFSVCIIVWKTTSCHSFSESLESLDSFKTLEIEPASTFGGFRDTLWYWKAPVIGVLPSNHAVGHDSRCNAPHDMGTASWIVKHGMKPDANWRGANGSLRVSMNAMNFAYPLHH